MRIFLVLLFALIAGIVNAQQFLNVTEAWQIQHSYNGSNYGGGVTVYDWDYDGRDDLIFCQKSAAPVFFHNTPDGLVQIQSPIPALNEAKQISFADYDNDGDADIFVTVYNSHPRLFKNLGDFYFVDATFQAGIPLQTVMSFSHSWADYNLDGFLDIHVCNYNGPSFPNPTFQDYLLKNNGNGTFTDAGNQLSANTTSYYTLASVFNDFNNDFIPDLFVANDRFTSQNYLYRGIDEGGFIEVSQAANMNSQILSMCATIGDVQNDGKTDFYVTNGTSGNLLHINNGDGTFSNMAGLMGVQLNTFNWGSVLLDFDNDTWADLFVNSTPHITHPGKNRFFKNIAGQGFEEISAIAGFADVNLYNHSVAAGDFNNDGKYDLVFSRESPGTSQVMLNVTKNENSFIKVSLKGVQSNRDGVGCWVMAYTGDGMVSRYTAAGEGYLSQHSQHVILGLGEAQIVDSLKVIWPGGFTDTFYQLPVNFRYIVEEGLHIHAQIALSQPENIICEGESIQLTCTQNEVQYLWSTGETTQSIFVDQTGVYSVQVFHQNGFTASSEVEIMVESLPTFEVTYSDVSCHGMNNGAVAILASKGAQIAWSDGEGSFARENLSPGQYDFELTNFFGCGISGFVEIDEPQELDYDLSIWSIEDEGEECAYTWSGTVENFVGGTEPIGLQWTLTFLDDQGSVLSEELITNIQSWTCKFGPLNVLMEMTDANGCFVAENASLSQLTDIESVSSLSGFSVYPNPTNGFSQVIAGRNFEKWEILSAQGKSFLSERFPPVHERRIDFPDTGSSILFIVVYFSDGSIDLCKVSLLR